MTALFLSTYVNKIDKKGRVSVPADFRAGLVAEDFSGMILYSAIGSQCLEACGATRIARISSSIDALDPYCEVRDSFATVILAGSRKVFFDSEGRANLPVDLMKIAQIEESVCFVGKGSVFQIWNPDLYSKHCELAREIVLQNRASLKLLSS